MSQLEIGQDFGAVVNGTVFLTPVPSNLSVQRAEAIMRVCARMGVVRAVYRTGESPLSDRMASLIDHPLSVRTLLLTKGETRAIS